MKENMNPFVFEEGEEPFSKIYPQPPKAHEETYTDTPDYSGYCPDCPRCGETMGYSYRKSEFKCPNCGFVMYEGEWDREEEERGGKPWVCVTCGGPWPSCETNCKMFDE